MPELFSYPIVIDALRNGEIICAITKNNRNCPLNHMYSMERSSP